MAGSNRFVAAGTCYCCDLKAISRVALFPGFAFGSNLVPIWFQKPDAKKIDTNRSRNVSRDKEIANTPEAFLGEGNRAYSEKRFDDAIYFYKKALEADPKNAVAFQSVGNVYVTIGKIQESVPFLEKSFTLSPQVDYARNLAKAYLRLQRFREAADGYKYIISYHPNDEEALNNYAACALYGGDQLTAATQYSKLVNLAPGELRYKSAFIASLSGMPINMVAASVKEAFVKCLQDDKISCLPAIDAWFSTISTSPEFKEVLERIARAGTDECAGLLKDQGVTKTLNQPLLCLGIEQLVHPADILETLFKKVRLAILNCPELSAPLVPFIRAMASQISLTEHAMFETPNETQKIEDILQKNISKQASELDDQELLILACYRSLRLVKPLLEGWPVLKDNEKIGGLIKLEITNFLTEQALKPTIPTLGSITNAVSQATRNQYEESPCPRWHSTYVAPQPEAMLERTKDLQILNAGCGTGQEVTNAAQTLKTSSFTGIDLSLSSIAYAKRQANEAGVQNIEFMQGDILEIEKLNKQFDIILSSGVLHHMEDTQKGLNKLASVLKPKGSRMLIGLYSKIAREHLFGEIWAHIKEKGYKANDKDIRQFRQDVLDSAPGHFLRNAQNFIDFKSLSECRDMLFHVQENLHTWIDIEEMINNAGLKLIKVLMPADLEQRYRQMFPDDPTATNVKNWHAFERQNPETFKSMYYFWLAHKDDEETAETSPAIWATNFI